MPKILISYRRSDSAGMTGRIFDRLVQRYGKNSVFMDVDNIPFGIDFRDHIKTALLESDLMLVVVGQRWLGRGEGPGSRLDDETDPVRVEVESALKAGLPLIPLLVDGASMPKASELPESLRPFSYRNAATIDSGRDFTAHVERLIRSIDEIIERQSKLAAAPASAIPTMPPPAPAPMSAAPAETVKPAAPVPPPAAVPPARPPASPASATVPPVVQSQPGAVAMLATAHALIRNPKDLWGGLALVAVAAFALWASSDLPGMRGFAFGPGTAPRLFAYMLMACGIGVALVGLFTDGPPEEDFAFSGPFGAAVLVLALIPITYYSPRIGHMLPGVAPDVIIAAVGATVVLALAFVMIQVAPRGPVFITAATLIFAVTVRPLGLVIASFVSLVVSAVATEEVRWIETMIWAAVLTLFCSLLFPYGLNLPLQLWPRF
jgi:hypothetical protein